MANTNNTAASRQSTRSAFETGGMYTRRSVSETSLIGRRLSRVYDVASEMPRDMDVLLRSLDGKIAR